MWNWTKFLRSLRHGVVVYSNFETWFQKLFAMCISFGLRCMRGWKNCCFCFLRVVYGIWMRNGRFCCSEHGWPIDRDVRQGCEEEAHSAHLLRTANIRAGENLRTNQVPGRTGTGETGIRARNDGVSSKSTFFFLSFVPLVIVGGINAELRINGSDVAEKLSHVFKSELDLFENLGRLSHLNWIRDVLLW